MAFLIASLCYGPLYLAMRAYYQHPIQREAFITSMRESLDEVIHSEDINVDNLIRLDRFFMRKPYVEAFIYQDRKLVYTTAYSIVDYDTIPLERLRGMGDWLTLKTIKGIPLDINVRYHYNAIIHRYAIHIAASVGAGVFIIYVMFKVRHLMNEINQLQLSCRKPNGELKVYHFRELNQIQQAVDNMERELRAMNHSLEQSHEALVVTTTSLSHDLRTPMTVILGNLEYLMLTEKSNVHIERSYTRAQQLHRHMNEMFRSFKEIAEGNRDNYVFKQYTCSSFYEKFIIPFTEACRDQGYVIMEINDEIDNKIIISRCLIERILDNMYSNLLKYASREQSCCITIQGTETTLVVSMTNHLNEACTKSESDDVGLHVCKSLMEAHGGRFMAYQIENEFHVSITFPYVTS